ncbi:serine hydrolase domain-containing protein [Catellatospora sp. KI3]|uniref:serine hydrolase domain-containing protein n=1 Tax=Catellatospora sp. KI3 TaxID=3041620 RepID=UPI0024828BAC|nr:serine hydrolase domain-containing protein [Catellatospora sp. KI3]MDI1461256.1 serine hydrolase domain-containing protein [Catellatospora sp. KI3]
MPELLDAAAALAQRCRTEAALAHTSSLLVAHRGVELAAYDLHADGLDTPVPTIASVTKSLLSTVTGWAWHDGLVRLDDTLGALLGDRVPPARRGATVHQLLSMTSGAAGGMLEIDEIMELPRGWVDELLRFPQTDPPGTVFRYDNGAPHLLAAALHQVTGDLPGYAGRVLARIGCAGADWPVDPEGVPYGFGDARLSPRALLRFGEAWRTGAAVPPAYRELAWTAHSPGGPPLDRGYGYLWWVAADRPETVHVAAGWAGQCVLVAPALELTVVATGSPDRWREGFSRSVLEELEPLVVAARRGAS